MGNGVGKLTLCFTGVSPQQQYGDYDYNDDSAVHRRRRCRRRIRDRKVGIVVVSDTFDDLGHSFCYIPLQNCNPPETCSSKTTTFYSISGAAVSANTSTPLSTSLLDFYSCNDRASAFESSNAFASLPLQPIPRNSGPLFNSGFIPNSGPLERGFLSGPIERASFVETNRFLRSYSHGGFAFKSRLKRDSLIGVLKRALSRGIKTGKNSIVAPIKGIASMKENDNWNPKKNQFTITTGFSLQDDDDDDSRQAQKNLQWAQGKAGEDRVHVVVSEDEGWVFVGIYDGFNGPDAPDFLLSNLYSSVRKELKGILWDDDDDDHCNPNLSLSNDSTPAKENLNNFNRPHSEQLSAEKSEESCSKAAEQDRNPTVSLYGERKWRSKYRGVARKREENQKRWRCQWDRERLEIDRRLNKNRSNSSTTTNHEDVLKALSQALKKTEESYLEIADMMLMENPELSLMGSCVLVMVMKQDDVYIMNVGDSRAILGQKKEPDLWSQELEKIKEETLYDLQNLDRFDDPLTPLQLTMEHSTSMQQETSRIQNEHPDDASAVINGRVKGSLKVTRAFGAGFLKQPNWNNALLEMFRIEYVGSSSYINCVPWLHHHRLTSRDHFLILSSDGLYQYFTNEEAVAEVQLFLWWSPEGDPAQHLVEELLFRAAKKAGMDFHELLEIPQGDRRRYHDDISVIVISLEGRFWRSST